MRFKKGKSLGIFLLLLLILFFRFWQLDQIPPGLNRDEVSIGYTAWSILKTGKDEYGHFLPLSIKSFGDWKLPLSVYLTIPFVALLGLNNWSVRLPFALAGLITLAFFYLLVREIFKAKREKVYGPLALIFLSLLPWHVHFSRYGHEGTFGLMFLTGGLLFFFKGLKKPRFLFFSALFLGLTFFAYYTYFIFTPLFLLGLIPLYLSKLKKFRKWCLVSFFLFLILAGIAFKINFRGAQVKSSISFLTDPVTIHTQIEIPRVKAGDSFLAKLIYNRPVIFGRLFLTKYVATFLPRFLVIKGGDNPLHNFPGLANLFWFQYPLFLLGLFYLSKKRKRETFLLFWWLLVSPVGSSLTKDAPNSGRVSPMIIPLVILITLGLVEFYQLLKKKQRAFFLILITLIWIQSLLVFYQAYFIKFPPLRVQNWGGGYQELVDYLNQSENKTKEILIQRPNYSPYIYLLFYSQYNPELYQKETVRYPPTEEGFYHVKKFSRYQFEDFKLEDKFEGDKMIVIWAETISDEERGPFSSFLKKEISDRGKTIFYVFEGKAD